MSELGEREAASLGSTPQGQARLAAAPEAQLGSCVERPGKALRHSLRRGSRLERGGAAFP